MTADSRANGTIQTPTCAEHKVHDNDDDNNDVLMMTMFNTIL